MNKIIDWFFRLLAWDHEPPTPTPTGPRTRPLWWPTGSRQRRAHPTKPNHRPARAKRHRQMQRESRRRNRSK